MYLLPCRDNDEDSDYEDMEVTDSVDGSAREVAKPAKDLSTVAALKDMFSKWIALLLIFVPISLFIWNLFEHTVPPVGHFFCNMFAIIPLSWVISESTEHLEQLVGPMWGTLLNSSFGNIVEIILSVQAIKEGLVEVVQNSLLGAIIMNTTGVLGLCVLASSGRRTSIKFNFNYAIYNLGLLSVALLALVVPTNLAVFDDYSTPKEMANLSRIVAGMMLFMYIQWLIFNLWSHRELFQSKKKQTEFVQVSTMGNITHAALDEQLYRASSQAGGLAVTDSSNSAEESGEAEEEATIAAPCACVMLLISTVLVAFHCEYLVKSIEPLTEECRIKTAFVAVVILPMVGNFSEVIAAVSIACKGKIDLAIGVAISSATQIALCVIPVAVFIGWAYDVNLDLDFEDFQVRILGTCIVVVVLVLLDGKATWLKGTLLVTVYIIVGAAFWFLHDREFNSAGAFHDREEFAALNTTLHTLQKEVEVLKQHVAT